MKIAIAVDGSRPADVAFNYVLDLGAKKLDEASRPTARLTRAGLDGHLDQTQSSREGTARNRLRSG